MRGARDPRRDGPSSGLSLLPDPPLPRRRGPVLLLPPPPAVATEGELLYIPYWRLRGSSFSVTASEVTHRFVDTNVLAVGLPELPASLGLRPQVLKLRYVSPATEGRFIAPALSADQAIPGLDAAPHNAFYREFIGETVSLIHAPLLLKGETLTDAILGKPVAVFTADARERLLNAAPAARTQVRFVPTLCPRCGWDMEGERDSLVLICRNCDTRMGVPGGYLRPDGICRDGSPARGEQRSPLTSPSGG